MVTYKIKVRPTYRKFVTNVSRTGFVQKAGSTSHWKAKSRKHANMAVNHIASTSFPRSDRKKSIARDMFRVVRA
jgi:hypothetical protein